MVENMTDNISKKNIDYNNYKSKVIQNSDTIEIE